MIKSETKNAPRRGGRPSRDQAGLIEERILDAAAALFFAEGYGATSVEEVARKAQISKRTFYARFNDKAALFSAVVHRLMNRLRPSTEAIDRLFEGKDVEEVLRRIAPVIMKAALTPEALSLYRVVQAEATRFPELALILNTQGARQEAITRIAALLHQRGKATTRGAQAAFAAEQFLLMLTAAPQRRALGLGQAMNDKELAVWATDTIDLFLGGCASLSHAEPRPSSKKNHLIAEGSTAIILP